MVSALVGSITSHSDQLYPYREELCGQEAKWLSSTLKIVGSCSSRGFDSTRSVMFTICRSVQEDTSQAQQCVECHSKGIDGTVHLMAGGRLQPAGGEAQSTACLLTLRAGD